MRTDTVAKPTIILLAALTTLLLACGPSFPPAVTAEATKTSTVLPAATPPAETPTPMPAPAATHRAQAAFGTPVSDASLLTLLERHDAKVATGYMYIANGNFSGTHRVAEPVEPAAFIAEARRLTAEFFTLSVGEPTTYRAQQLLEMYTAKDLATDPLARQHVASFLELLDDESAAITAAPGGRPLIYAVEVHGSEEQLRQLGTDESVIDFQIVALDSAEALHWPPHPTNFIAQGAGRADATTTAEDGYSLYQRMVTIANRELESETK